MAANTENVAMAGSPITSTVIAKQIGATMAARSRPSEREVVGVLRRTQSMMRIGGRGYPRRHQLDVVGEVCGPAGGGSRSRLGDGPRLECFQRS